MQNRRIQGGFLYRGAIAKDKGIGKHGNRALPRDWEQQSCYHSERKREEGGWHLELASLKELMALVKGHNQPKTPIGRESLE